MATLRARYFGEFSPVYPCRIMTARHCPAIYDGVCGDRPCARLESKDEAPWLPELDPGPGRKTDR